MDVSIELSYSFYIELEMNRAAVGQDHLAVRSRAIVVFPSVLDHGGDAKGKHGAAHT